MSPTPLVGTAIVNQAINPTILLELSESGGKVIFSKKSDLDSWTWSMLTNESRAFIYGRGESGTYFQPLSHTENRSGPE